VKRRTLVLFAIAASTLSSCSMLDSLERELVFRPVTEEWRGYSPAVVPAEEHWIPVGEGERVHAWWIRSGQPQCTLVFFHGARVNLSGSIYRLRGFRDAGCNVLAFDYRGFGRSSARQPSEESVYEDGEAVIRWLDARTGDALPRILYGHSLGGPIAAEAALRGARAAALVLESTFTSVPEMTRFGSLVTQRLDLLDKLPRIDLPVLIVHGAEDDVVPPEMARRLYEAARGPKRLLMVEGAGHRWVAFPSIGAIFAQLRELTARVQ
jgi:pimeloyl-ACP methyl ester carboxylesterase